MTRQAPLLAAAGGALGGAAFAAIAFALSHLGTLGWTMLGALAAAAGAVVAVAGARWYELSMTDPGTGLLNRRSLFRRLAGVLDDARRSGAPVALIVIDVDNFRQYNNRHGHLVGDDVLLAVARTLRAGVRRGDMVGRWGGEEFAVILPGADLGEALAVAERLRSAVAQLAVSHGAGTVRVTISAGVAATSQNGFALRPLVDQADRAMYAAKERKNLVLSM